MKTRLKLIGGVLASLLALTACGGESSSDSADGPLRVAAQADASSLDPIRSTSGYDRMLLYPVYDTLISFDQSLQPAPGLATAWEWKDSTTLALTLREGVTFHDGTTFDAEAVKFNIERAKGEGSKIVGDLASIESVDVVDSQHVVLNLAQPDSALIMNTLADRGGMMVSPTAAEKAGGDLSAAPVGTGGWSFVKANRGSTIEYTKFDDYWDSDAVRAPTLTFSIMTDPKTRVSALKSGQIDVANEIAPSDAESLASSSNAELAESDRLQLSVMYVDQASEELADPRVRRAINLAIDREAIAEAAYFGHATPASALYPSDYWAAPAAGGTFAHDPDGAKELLSEAGMTDGLTVSAITNSDTASVRLAEILKDQLAEAGITLEIQPMELVQATTSFFADRKAPLLISVWTGRPDPVGAYRALFSEAGFYNAGHVGTPAFEKLLGEVSAVTEESERAGLIGDLGDVIHDESLIVPIAHQSALVGLSSSVKGFENNLLGQPKFIGVSVQK